MMKATMIAIFATAMILSSCGDSSTNRSSYGFDGYSGSGYFETEGQEDSEEMYVCPMCGGSGVFEYMPGDVMAPREVCQGCGGNKVVTARQARAIAEAKAQVDAMTGGYGSSGFESGGSGRSADEINYSLRKAYELLESMEEDYRNCSSVVMKAQYPRMISEQKELIRRLENELRYAQ